MGSFAKASASLGFSQSVLSRHMDALEAELGVRLLERSTHGLRPTNEGRYALARASEIADIVASMERHFKKVTATRALTVSGAFENGRIVALAREAVARMGHAGELRVVDEAALGSPFAALVLGDIDAFVTFAADERLAELPDGLTAMTLFDMEFAFAMSPRHPLAGRTSLTMADVRGQTVTHFEGNYLHSRAGWLDFVRVCEEAGFYPRSRSLQLDSPTDLFTIDIGDCLSPVSGQTPVTQMCESGGLVMVPVADAGYPRFVGVLRKGDRRSQAFFEQMRLGSADASDVRCEQSDVDLLRKSDAVESNE